MNQKPQKTPPHLVVAYRRLLVSGSFRSSTTTNMQIFVIPFWMKIFVWHPLFSSGFEFKDEIFIAYFIFMFWLFHLHIETFVIIIIYLFYRLCLFFILHVYIFVPPSTHSFDFINHLNPLLILFKSTIALTKPVSNLSSFLSFQNANYLYKLLFGNIDKN